MSYNPDFFVRSREASVDGSGGIYTLDQTLAAGKEIVSYDMVVSSDKNDVVFELLYSEDNGTTWKNPWDAGSDFIVKLHLNKGIPFTDNLSRYNFAGGTNRKLRIKITNNNANAAKVSFTVKGYIK